MNKSTVVITVKYDVTHQRSMKAYLVYMGSQELRRVGDSLDEDIFLKDDSFSNKETINEIEQFKNYIGYMSDRPGSTGLFTDDKHRVVNVIKDGINYEGLYYTTVISMREKDAIKYNISSKQAFVTALKMSMPLVAKRLKIPERDFRYLAAFHIKTPEMQKKNGAGKQPHLHVLFWDQNNARKHKVMNKKELAALKYEITKSLFYGYQKGYYEKRNHLKKQILDEVNRALDDRERFYDSYNRLHNRIEVLTNQKGSLNYGRFLKEYSISKSLVDKSNGFNHINNYRFNELRIILEQIQAIQNSVLNQANTRELIKQWGKISIELRSFQGLQLAEESAEIDFDELKLIINNKIIRFAAHESKRIDSWEIIIDLRSYISQGKLVYQNIDLTIRKQIAEIIIKAVVFDPIQKFEGKNKYNEVIKICRLLDVDFTEQYYFVNELLSGSKTDGFFIDELELVDRYLRRERVDTELKSVYGRAYFSLPNYQKGEWIESENLFFKHHIPLESNLKKHIKKYWDDELLHQKNLVEQMKRNKLQFISKI